MMKKEAKSSDDFKKLFAVKQSRSVYISMQAGDKVKTEKSDQASHSVNRKVKFED